MWRLTIQKILGFNGQISFQCHVKYILFSVQLICFIHESKEMTELKDGPPWKSFIVIVLSLCVIDGGNSPQKYFGVWKAVMYLVFEMKF